MGEKENKRQCIFRSSLLLSLGRSHIDTKKREKNLKIIAKVPVEIPSPALGDFWWYGISVFGPFRQPGQYRKKGSRPITLDSGINVGVRLLIF